MCSSPKSQPPHGQPGSIFQGKLTTCVWRCLLGTDRPALLPSALEGQWAVLAAQEETPTTMEPGVLCRQTARCAWCPRGSLNPHLQ